MNKGSIAVIDFGSQYTQLIVRRVREEKIDSYLVLPDEAKEKIKAPSAVILSGGPSSVSDKDAPDIDFEWLKNLGVPILGICYGMQLSNLKWGGEVSPSSKREYGPAKLQPTDVGKKTLFKGLSDSSMIWMSHSDTVSKIPKEASVIATNQDKVPVAIQWADDYFGIQFHPEVTHSDEGRQVIRNFISLAKDPTEFSMESIRDELILDIKKEVKGKQVVCGVSGGVDSTVLAVLLKEAGVDMKPVFVDHGLLRKNEAIEVEANFARLGIDLEPTDVSEIYLKALAGEDDPEKKRKIIGDLFVDVFFESAGNVEMLAQGTLYPDVIESGTSGSSADTIKTHHNRVDRILELQKEGKVIEPLASLFKDEVRELGLILGIPHDLLYRHPFPGPGLAVRCPGEVTEDKLKIIREADHVFIEALHRYDWYKKVWQAYACLIPVKTVGVKGDERSYEFAVSLRAVVSEDAMTADWVELPPELLRNVSNEILNTVSGVNRVLYDISTKPPASIEWE